MSVGVLTTPLLPLTYHYPQKRDLGLLQHPSFQPLTIITKCSILDVATALDSPLNHCCVFQPYVFQPYFMFFKLYKEYEIVQIITYIQVFFYFLDNKLHAIDEENMNIMWKNIMWMNQIFFWGGGGGGGTASHFSFDLQLCNHNN